MLLMSFTSLGAGFVRAEIPLIVLRALMGVGQSPQLLFAAHAESLCTPGAALNIPSAMSLIIRLFPNPASQSKALAGFAGAAAFGNGMFATRFQRHAITRLPVLGLIIGALLASFASWPWIFYFICIFSFILAVAVLVLTPSVTIDHSGQKYKRFKRLDLLGVSFLTSTCFISGAWRGVS
jgi:MFS family permease